MPKWLLRYQTCQFTAPGVIESSIGLLDWFLSRASNLLCLSESSLGTQMESAYTSAVGTCCCHGLLLVPAMFPREHLQSCRKSLSLAVVCVSWPRTGLVKEGFTTTRPATRDGLWLIATHACFRRTLPHQCLALPAWDSSALICGQGSQTEAGAIRGGRLT